MAKIVVLGVCGLKRSGKDTVSDICCSLFGTKKIRFADPLKNMVKAGFGFSDDQMHDNGKDVVDDRYNVTPRSILQFVGTEVMQFQIQTIAPKIGRNFWSDRLISDIKDVVGEGHDRGFVISDMRFVHEYTSIKKFCDSMQWTFKIIHVYNPTVHEADKDSHVSETEWKHIPANFIMLNGGSISDLRTQIKSSLGPLFGLHFIGL